jgi:hypothetical protein
MGLIHCPETSINDYHSTLHNTPEERSSLATVCFYLFQVTLVADDCTMFHFHNTELVVTWGNVQMLHHLAVCF